ncbi:amino acid ABC transporter substrate-binding protein [Pseudomonas sp. CCI3.2]|uniref:substrate-binding periplasmic protein n=2 Tax=Pseudomonas TaxID=286 RepID=UPI002AC9CE5B|nr:MULTISPECIES: transporter substrate-binding domain-containing protein [unclassified Pseudomonas]MEB0077921.1 amino acid ABC transporter substrate-binding protein [Pseudomonas sp. MH10out]MEB0101635.1 amino acid ABC transporter substrate-binding protein [Pseudomonas sp. CCI3.2]MEB0129491.1 amino acid ABC transporter substrate-binding protein [Pseudomonas sp. CCI2.4]MEB0157311.1 amino acid ABC transporter substrate-binding protein [Pseudomonas sp. AH2 (2023)]MEB0166529.1 amino acid ABC transp
MSSFVRIALRVPLLALCMLWTLQASAQQLVRIGAAHFPPYTIRPEKGEDTGLLPQLVEALNAVQTDFRFVLVPTSIPRRFRDFQQGRTDMAIFENPNWGWKDIPHVSVDMGLEDAEIFVARRVDGRTQSYFDHLQGKRLALFSGYHYEFAGFNADPKYLAEHFDATLTYSHDANLLMVLRDRADIALVTRSYLSDYMARNSDEASQLLVSERIDQVYRHFALLSPKAGITGEQFSALLQKTRENGQMFKIFQPLRIAVSPIPTHRAVAAEGQN